MKTKGILTIIAIATLTSCISSKDITYFIGANDLSETETAIYEEPTIKNSDLLKITIYADDPLAIAPFNSITIKDNDIEKLNQSNFSYNESQYVQTFLVNQEGNIILPILGNVKIAGLKKSEASQKIKEYLTPYIKNPIVSIQYMNFRITVLGEVNKPGTYIANNEQINILEALGMAGDITIYGKRKNILLIRDKGDNKKEFIRIDMTKTNIFSSPYFYLQSRDILYIEPMSHKKNK